MPVYNIPIIGIIGSPEDESDKGKYFQFTDLLTHLNNSRAFDTLNLDVNSEGGYCDIADRMIEALKKTGKKITSCNSGKVCSAASKIFTLPGAKADRTYYPERGIFLIHNPWGVIEGDSTVLTQASKELKTIENEYAQWYANQTGSDIEILKAFMAENVALTAEQVESLGLATVVHEQVKAFAKLKSNNQNMNQQEFEKKMSLLDKFIEKISAMFKIKALMLNDVNGNELEMPDITDPSEVVAGIKVNAGGQPANGEYTMPDGSVLKCENGVVIEIVPAPAGDDMEAVKKENEQLKTELEAMKAEKVAIEAKVQEAENVAIQAKAEMVKFKKEFSSFSFKASTPGEDKKDEPQSRKLFKTK